MNGMTRWVASASWSSAEAAARHRIDAPSARRIRLDPSRAAGEPRCLRWQGALRGEELDERRSSSRVPRVLVAAAAVRQPAAVGRDQRLRRRRLEQDALHKSTDRRVTPQNSGTTAGLHRHQRGERAGGLGGRASSGPSWSPPTAARHWRSGVVPGAETVQFRDVEAFSEKVAYLLSVPDRGSTERRFPRGSTRRSTAARHGSSSSRRPRTSSTTASPSGTPGRGVDFADSTA